jgi:DNA-binding MarR family transcriptional regulator
MEMSKDTESRSRIHIKVGDIEIDVSGAQQEVDAEILKLREEEDWSAALAKVRSAREEAIAAAVDAAKRSGLPERGTAFKALLDNCNLTKRPDQVLAALHYLRDVEGVNDSPPRVMMDLFEDAGIGAPGNLSLYINRLRERGFLTIPPSAHDKNRYAVLTPEGRAHLDKRSRN